MLKMKQFSVLVLLLCMACANCWGKEPRSDYEKDGGFSYNPPAGWQMMDFPGSKYKVSHGDPKNGFAPNINIVDETYTGSLADYVDANVVTLKKVFVGFKILKREDFQTEDGQAGIRLVVEDQQQTSKLRQTFYFFSNGNRKYVATCSALADGGDALDATFETSMKSFRLH